MSAFPSFAPKAFQRVAALAVSAAGVTSRTLTFIRRLSAE
jgi:hypothetical protein